jgi:hypothetical protein
MDGRSQRIPALLAAGAAIVLIASMFLEWYTIDLPEGTPELDGDLPTFTAFEGLERADVAIVVAAGLAVIVAGLVLAGVLASSPAPGLALVALSLFALAVVLYRGVISPPGLAFLGLDLELEASFGWFISVAAAALILVGALLTYLSGPRLEFAPAEALEREEPSGEPSAEATSPPDD